MGERNKRNQQTRRADLGESQAEKVAQSQRFVEAARELGCDESEEAFDAALKAVAKHKPKREEPTEAPEEP